MERVQSYVRELVNDEDAGEFLKMAAEDTDSDEEELNVIDAKKRWSLKKYRRSII